MFIVSLISFIVLAAVYAAVRIYIVVKQRNIIKQLRMLYHDEKNERFYEKNQRTYGCFL